MSSSNFNPFDEMTPDPPHAFTLLEKAQQQANLRAHAWATLLGFGLVFALIGLVLAVSWLQDAQKALSTCQESYSAPYSKYYEMSRPTVTVPLEEIIIHDARPLDLP